MPECPLSLAAMVIIMASVPVRSVHLGGTGNAEWYAMVNPFRVMLKHHQIYKFEFLSML